MFCPKCGSENVENANFCDICGAKLSIENPDIQNTEENRNTVAAKQKKPLSKGALAAIIAGAVALIAVVVFVVISLIPNDHDVTLKDMSDIMSDGNISADEIMDVFGDTIETTGHLYYNGNGEDASGQEGDVTFYEIPIEGALCYYEGEDEGKFAFFFHQEYANEVKNIIQSKCIFEQNLMDQYHVYSYGDAEITANSDYTYINISFIDHLLD